MVSPPTNLYTKRLLLREIEDNDLENIFKGLSNPKVVKYYGVSFSSPEGTKEQMQWYKNLKLNKRGIWWTINAKDNQTFYGAIGFNDVDKENKKTEIGFWLIPDFWQQGFIQEALPVITHYGFNQLKLHRIEAFVESENEPCKRVLERQNFDFEGRLIDCEVKNGMFISLDVYAKINQYLC